MLRSQTEGPFEANLSGYPLLEVRSPSVAMYDHVNVSTFWSCVDLGLKRGRPFMLLHNAIDIPNLDDARRKQFMAMLNERRREVDRLVVGYGALVGSPLDRGLITSFVWTVGLKLPLRIFSSEREARIWLWSRYEERKRTLGGQPITAE